MWVSEACDDARVISDARALIEMLHARPTRLVYDFAGAGASALALLHAVAGSSRTLLEATDRYAPQSLIEGVGKTPDRFVSSDVAVSMARRALVRARHLAGSKESVAGIALTATIATDREKRGEHRLYLAAADDRAVRWLGLKLIKGARDRDAEEALITRLVLTMMAEAKGVLARLALDLQDDELIERHLMPSPPFAALLEGERSMLALDSLGRCVDALPWAAAGGVRAEGVQGGTGGAVVSGAFNPLHQGHLGLAAAAQRFLARPVAFELSLDNADKPPLDAVEAHLRTAQFAGRAPLLLTRAARFDAKAQLLPDTVFVLGADTAVRLLEPRFYPSSGLADALNSVRAHGCRFLVAGRRHDGTFQTLSQLNIPAEHRDLFTELPEHAFRADVSSSEIREAWAHGEAVD